MIWGFMEPNKMEVKIGSCELCLLVFHSPIWKVNLSKRNSIYKHAGGRTNGNDHQMKTE